MWNEMLIFINDNKDALSWLFGSGSILIIYRIILGVLRENRTRKTRSDENFPFKIILPNSSIATEILGGNDNDLLADRNILYQQRVSGRSIRREIEDLLNQHRWVLITGKTGIGKTREVLNLAESLNKEGWTILYLTRERWLSAPSKLPNNIPDRKLLFILDDLNRKIYASRVEQAPRAKENILQPLTIPLQDRLLETLKTFETLCGKNDILVIATARVEKFSDFADEPSEWDKLEINKYNDFWKWFAFYSLPEAEDDAEISLLSATTRMADIKADASEFPIIAKRNDGTFANLVENLRTVSNTSTLLQVSTFRDTLKGTWDKRYQDAVTKYPFAKYIYDGIDLARTAGLPLSFWNAYSIANIIAGNDLARFNYIKNIYTLHYLVRTENILEPRDGQIEAKGYRVSLEKFLISLYKQVFAEWVNMTSYITKIRSGFLGWVKFLLIPKTILEPILLPSRKLGIFQKLISVLLDLVPTTNNLGNAYNELGFTQYANQLYLRSSELMEANPIYYYFFSRGQAAIWYNLGETYRTQGQYEASINALEKSMRLSAKNNLAWGMLGNVYRDLGKIDDSIHAYRKSIESNAKNPIVWNNLGNAYTQLNYFDDALLAYKKSVEVEPKSGAMHSSLASILRRLRRYEEAEQEIEIARRLIEDEGEFVNSRFASLCGETEDALRLLKISLDKGQITALWVRQDPEFDTIRDDPRFQELVGEKGIEETIE